MALNRTTANRMTAKSRLARFVVICLIAATVACTSGSNTDTSRQPNTTGETTASTASTPTPPTDAPTTTQAVLGGINGTSLEKQFAPAVARIYSRDCHGGLSTGSAFAIDKETFVTNWHVVADDDQDPESAVDPRPWVFTYKRQWRRGSVVGAVSSPDVAVIRLDPDEPEVDSWLSWADRDARDGEFMAAMGYPGVKDYEFQLTVASVAESSDETRGIPSFRINKELSARTGGGNSGGPVLDKAGKVTGVLTWGLYDLRSWFVQDMSVVRDQVEQLLTTTPDVPVGCDADGPERYPLTYVVKLGTFSNMDDYTERLEVVDPVSPQGARIIRANTEDESWFGFLLSKYPFVMLGGPFDTKEKAHAARKTYQAAIDSAGQKDTFSIGVIPLNHFPSDDAEPIERCSDTAIASATVTGVNSQDKLKFRKGPSLDEEVITELDNGELVQVIDGEVIESGGFEWIYVAPLKLDGDECGWVARKYTTYVPDE